MIRIDSSAGRLLVLASIFLAPEMYGAADLDARSGSRDDVQAAIDAAKDGDTVRIPAGTFVWTKAIRIGTDKDVGGKWTIVGQKHLTIQGAGIDRTIIVDEVPRHPNGIDDALFVIHTLEGKPFRLTGMTLRGGATETGWAGAVQIRGTSKRVRVDRLKFDHVQARGLHIDGEIYGVVDHCEFVIGAWLQAIWVGHSAWGGRTYGDGSWASPLALGTEKAIFIEDNIFRAEGAGSATATVDSWMGGRWVFRHNRVVNMTIGNHGTESSGRWRGCFSMEIYRNVFERPDPKHWATVGGSRSGTAVIFENTVTGPYDGFFPLDNYREWHAFPPWGACDGTGPYDLNDGVVYDEGTHAGADGAPVLTAAGKRWTPNQWVGHAIHNTRRGDSVRIVSNTADTISVVADSYPRKEGPFAWKAGDPFKIMKAKACLDGIGRGTGLLLSGDDEPAPRKWLEQAIEPLYAWKNTRNGAEAKLTSRSLLAQEEKEFFNGTLRPGYTPYPYPHPLQKE